VNNKGVTDLLISMQTQINEMIDDEMAIFLEPIPESIKELLSYYYSQGGKRLRPALLLATAQAFDSDENLAPYALIIELIHTMSLYHDDVIDGAKERRGAPTVHIKWDKPTAIVGGDIFHALIHNHLLTAIQQKRIKKTEVAIKFLVDLIQTVEVKIGTAVLQEMAFSQSQSIPELSDVVEVTAGKTAPLFAFCAAAGAYLSEKDSLIVEDMYEMGWKIGYAFQLLDDVADFFKSDKDSGGDLREDKKTPLLVLANSKNSERVRWYQSNRMNLTSKDISQFIFEFREEFHEVLNWVKKEIHASKAYLTHIPENRHKELILGLYILLESKVSEVSNALNADFK
jgi:geranylgeranyl pyrophosphate synthase